MQGKSRDLYFQKGGQRMFQLEKLTFEAEYNETREEARTLYVFEHEAATNRNPLCHLKTQAGGLFYCEKE